MLEGYQRVFHDEQRHLAHIAGQGVDFAAHHYCGDGSICNGVGYKIVAVEALAADGEEEGAGLNGARVDGVAGGGEIFAHGSAELGSAPMRDLMEFEFHAGLPFCSSLKY